MVVIKITLQVYQNYSASLSNNIQLSCIVIIKNTLQVYQNYSASLSNNIQFKITLQNHL
ncbi:hypothetical protein HanPSC8_Chr00c092g0804371 [Helianthus annuus]|nr:hypothetical protein HanPSC8_Chr00c092g0804371 [Helianthus annuus]